MQQNTTSDRPNSSKLTLAPVLVGATALATLGFVASAAAAETRGYVVSWFATATNNPDFATNCPELAKNPEVVKGLENTGRAPDRASVNGQPVPPLDYPDAVQ